MERKDKLWEIVGYFFIFCLVVIFLFLVGLYGYGFYCFFKILRDQFNWYSALIIIIAIQFFLGMLCGAFKKPLPERGDDLAEWSKNRSH